MATCRQTAQIRSGAIYRANRLRGTFMPTCRATWHKIAPLTPVRINASPRQLRNDLHDRY